MPIVVIPAPTDYEHPERDPIRNIGDRVRDLSYDYGYGTIISVSDHYYNREDARIERRNYGIQWETGGESAGYFGWQTELAPLVPLIDRIRADIAAALLDHNTPTAIELTQAGRDRLVAELDNMLIANDIATDPANQQIHGYPLFVMDTLPNGLYRVRTDCLHDNHKWFSYVLGFGYIDQMCRVCGAKRRQYVEITHTNPTFDIVKRDTHFELTSTVGMRTKVISVDISNEGTEPMIDIPDGKAPFFSDIHRRPLNRRLCLNMRVAKHFGYQHFKLGAMGDLYGFRDVKEGDTGIVTIGNHDETMVKLPDYSGDLTEAARLLHDNLPPSDAPFKVQWCKYTPAEIAADLCKFFLRWQVRRKLDTLDRG